MIYTFYSFKGGVGRSMALAAVSYIFARRGLKVLAIDFDLEAPGLERYFFESRQAEELRKHLGLIDLLQTYKKAMTSEAEFQKAEFKRWWDFVDEAVPSIPGGGKVDILTAGCREPEEKLRDYALAVRTFDWQDFFANWNGEKFFDWLRKQLIEPPEGAEHPGYDVVLVDSRTGVTEMGGVSAYQLADCAVMLCAANHQNIEGTAAVARDFRSDSVLALRRGRPLELLVIPARLEDINPKREEFFERFAEVFAPAEYFPQILLEAGLDYRRLALPYDPELAVIERLVGDSEAGAGWQAVASFERLADALALLAAPADRPGRLAATAPEAKARLLGETPAGAAAAEPVADPTSRSAGFDVYLDAARADQALASRIEAELKERGLRVLYAEEPNLLALGICETLVVCLGDSGSSEAAPRLVASVRDRKQGAPAIVPLLLAAESDPCPSGRAAARALELESQLIYLDPNRDGWVDRLLAAIRRARPTVKVQAAAPVRDPYPGERAFAEDDAALFFGRDEELAVLVEMIENNRIVWLIGAAGVGKSSLVGAGLLPRWRQQLAGRSAEILSIDCATEELEMWGPLAWTPRSGERRIVLDHIDSFPLGGRENERKLRLDVIAQIAVSIAREAENRLVLVCRDVFDLEDRTRLFNVARPDATFWLDALAPAGLQQAIERPAGRAGHLFEHGLVQLLMENAGRGASAVAQVQRLLPKLWQERKRGWLTTSAYNQAGGVAGSFERNLVEFRNGLPSKDQEALDTLLRSLVYYDRNLRLLADVADWRDLASVPDIAAIDAVSLRDRLADRHLIALHRGSPSTSEKERTRIGLVFPTPESYGKVVDLVPDPGFALWRRRFAGQLQGWQQNERSADFLLKGAALFEAQVQAQKYSDLLTASEHGLINASVDQRKLEEAEARDAELARRETEELQRAKKAALAERDRAVAAQERTEVERSIAEEQKFRADAAARRAAEEARRAVEAARRARHLLAILVAVAALLALAVILLVVSRRGLEESRSATQLAASDAVIRAYAEKDPTAAALALEILMRDKRTPDFVRNARFALLDGPMAWRELFHPAIVLKVLFSPDGQRIATISADNKVRLWSIDGLLEGTLEGHRGAVIWVEFSPDGQRVLTGSMDKTARLFDLQGHQLTQLSGHDLAVFKVLFSRNGREILTVAADGARLWKDDGTFLRKIASGGVFDAILSPEGFIVVTSSGSGTQIWDQEGRMISKVTEGPYSRTYSQIPFVEDSVREAVDNLLGITSKWHGNLHGFPGITFTKDGRRLALNSNGRMEFFDLRGRRAEVFQVDRQDTRNWQFSPDERQMLTATFGGDLLLGWPKDGFVTTRLVRNVSGVRSAIFSPDGKRILALVDEGAKAFIFDSVGGFPIRLNGHPGRIVDATFSPNGTMVATASDDKTVRLWRLDGRPARILRGHGSGLNQVAYSPDGQRLATSSSDQTARVWSTSGEPLATLAGHQAPVMVVQFSPDSQKIVTTSLDGTTRLWRANGESIAKVEGPSRRVETPFFAEFSPDSQAVLTFDTSTSPQSPLIAYLGGKVLTRMPGFPANFWGRFSPDGLRIVIGGYGARIFARNGTPLTGLPGHGDRVLLSRFSPDGQKVATSCNDGKLRIFRLDGTLEAQYQGPADAGAAVYFEWRPDGLALVVSFEKGSSRIVAPNGELLAVIETGASRPQSMARYNSAGGLIATISSTDNNVALWSGGGRALGDLAGHKDSVQFLDFSPDGNYLASASADTSARIWPISEAAFSARLREIAKPCLNVREWRIFFPFDDENTAKQKVDECEARASGAPTQ